MHQWHSTLDFRKEVQKMSNDVFLHLPHCPVVENNHLALLMKNITSLKLKAEETVCKKWSEIYLFGIKPIIVKHFLRAAMR